ncbi:hypothetical protein AKJ09_07528 [Labilithrix luteola]|uniref:Uncharacterized protein n=1 Tax=Labilithrix luteola TaxID=1391654 RepID=A0A0K1Q636_9BACT|nr:hypothetical protein AKJ09_07528 [Labilithrix luteola]
MVIARAFYREVHGDGKGYSAVSIGAVRHSTKLGNDTHENRPHAMRHRTA